MVLDSASQHENRWASIVSIAPKIGCAPQALNQRVKNVDVDSGQRGGITTEQAQKTAPFSPMGPRTMARPFEREVREIKHANEILRKASVYSAPSQRMFQSPAGQRDGARLPTETMIWFMEDHRADHGGKPLIAPLVRATLAARFAGFCRLPQRYFTPTRPSAQTLHTLRITPNVTQA